MNRAAWQRLVGEWLAWLRAGGMPASSVYLRGYQLGRLAADLANVEPWSVTDDDLAQWLGGHPWSRETVRSYRSAVRSFYTWGHSMGLADHNPAALLRKVPPVQAKPRPAAERVVEAALGRSDERAYLMLQLGARHGLRRAEIAQVHTRDILREVAGWTLLVHGKGGKERLVPLLDDVAAALRECPPGWIFPNGNGGHLSAPHVGVLLRRVLEAGTTPHQLRHRFASMAYQRTRDIRAVQELLGHASVATTERYTAIGGTSMRDAVMAAGRMGA